MRENGAVAAERSWVLCVLGLWLTSAAFAGRVERLVDWEFSRDGRAWAPVSVPHDWAIRGPFDATNDYQVVAIRENQEKEEKPQIGRTGALPWMGHGEYRRTVALPRNAKSADLLFDGAMSHARVFVNGAEIKRWVNGYAPFAADLSGFLGATQLEVRVTLDNPPESSRWYPGAGLIRPVWLRTDLVAKPEDVFVRTERVENDVAYLRVERSDGTSRSFEVAHPKLWTPETPHLYTLEPEGIRYGIRTVGWTNGVFNLNGARRNFRGVCLHHDLGPVGAAFNAAAFRRQVRLLKEIGCDAIRTSHNIPSSEQLDICDEMGMMVMAESFDEWEGAKCDNGYHRAFLDWWEKDLEALVRFGRNHPSVVMWSIGNEILDQREVQGTEWSKKMVAFVHRLDPTRPVTQGHSWMPFAITAGGPQVMDIPGLTYRLPFYETIRSCSKYGGVLGAETASTVSSRGVYYFPDEPLFNTERADKQCSSYDLEYCVWSNLPDDDFAMQDDHDWTLGEFVWTGFDYLGEPFPNCTVGARSSYFGIYDLAGLPKDRAYLYRARWRKDDPTLHVLPHWTWPGREGQVTPVYVYTSYPSAELFVNGVSQGRKTFDKATRLDRYRLRWRDVVYRPGRLDVVAYDANGRAAATNTVLTAGRPHHLVLTPDRRGLSGREDLSFVTVDVVDEKGTLCPAADFRMDFSVTGAGRFRGACNGDAGDFDSMAKPTLRAFKGRLVVVVEATGGTGQIELCVTPRGEFPAARVTLESLELPPEGLYIATGVYEHNGSLVMSGRNFTYWTADRPDPETIVSRVHSEGVGNALQFWQGGDRLLALAQQAKKLGLYTTCIYSSADASVSKRLHGELGSHYLGYDFGERFNFGIHGDNKFTATTLRGLADDYVSRVKAHVDERRAAGWGPIMATSANFSLDYEIYAGTDIPCTEDFAFGDLTLSTALSRGLCRQYGLAYWGSHIAHEWYSWIPYRSPWKMRTLETGLQHKYMTGAKLIVNESGAWEMQSMLCPDSPMSKMPILDGNPPGLYGQNDPRSGWTPEIAAEARKRFSLIDDTSPQCVEYRRILREFTSFCRANPAPAGQPETTFALAKGNLDLGPGGYHPAGFIAAGEKLAETNPDWRCGTPEQSWDVALNSVFPKPPMLAPWNNRLFAATPYGQGDIVSFAYDHVTAEHLLKNYRTVMFSGWNTCSERQYRILCEYVQGGGRLVIGLCHLSTNDARRIDFRMEDLVHGGDFSELCGLRVKGKGPKFYWATRLEDKPNDLGLAARRRYGKIMLPIGNVELTGAASDYESLAVDDENLKPVILRCRRGKGEVLFLNVWSYPAAANFDEGPGATVDSPGLVGELYRYAAKMSRGHVYITGPEDADPDEDCRWIVYSYFPDAGRICLLNLDYVRERRFVLHQFGEKKSVTLAPGEFRLIDAAPCPIGR